nr:manganese catalase family protein [Lacrimispora aerotolerans]
MEIVAAIVHQLTRNLTPEQVVESGLGPYYIDHTTGIWPQSAEQKARSTYDNILRVITDPEICDLIRFLREIVHFQRFGEALRITQDNLDSKNFYAFNPSFDIRKPC